MTGSWRFSANYSLMYTDQPMLDRLATAAADGFSTVECQFPYEIPASTLKERLDDHGLSQVLINAPAGDWLAGDRGIAAIAGREAEFREAAEKAAQYADTVSCPRIHVMAGVLQHDSGADSDVQGVYERAFDTYLSNLDWLKSTYKGQALTWLIEPINQRDFPSYLINTQAQAQAIVQSLDAENIAVLMDLYHCQVTEGDVEMRLREFLPTGRVRHIQIASAPKRHEPDLGELNYRYVFDVLTELGYDGYVGCEYRPSGNTSEGVARWKAYFGDQVTRRF